MEVSDSLSAVHYPWEQPCHGQLQTRPVAAADHPPWTLKGSALVPQLVPWREVTLQLIPARSTCPKVPRWETGLPILSGRKKVLAGASSPALTCDWGSEGRLQSRLPSEEGFRAL